MTYSETKNQWARDDPAFVLILTFLLLVASAAYAIAFSENGVLQIIWLIFWTIVVDFVIYGLAISTVYWYLANKFLRSNISPHTVEQSVEWLYAVDVHCNAFFTTFITLYLGIRL